MKQFLIAFAMLLAACSSTRHDSGLDSSMHTDHAHARAPETATPGAALRSDEFDAAAPISVAEAAKAAGSGEVMTHADHDAHGEETTAIYACPMHPEVTSTTPGKCPKCGMTLVKRNKQ